MYLTIEQKPVVYKVGIQGKQGGWKKGERGKLSILSLNTILLNSKKKEKTIL